MGWGPGGRAEKVWATRVTYTPSTYGDEIAEFYDGLHGEASPRAVATLAELAGSGPALELGIGTGRLALPLRELGVRVRGVDASRAMIERLRAKPGGADIAVAVGDFSRVTLDETFALVFVAFNTFFNLLTAEDQVQCFRNVATMLRPDGVFLIEAFVPDLGRFDRGQRLAVSRMEPTAVWVEAAVHDSSNQLVDAQLVRLSSEGIRLFPVRVRYAWPSELDLMAQIAGLRLRERWAGWAKETFSTASTSHVTVYERAD
jgi:SAM-dependent methyltransferase